MAMINTTVRLDAETDRAVKRAAKAAGVPVGVFIRSIITENMLKTEVEKVIGDLHDTADALHEWAEVAQALKSETDDQVRFITAILLQFIKRFDDGQEIIKAAADAVKKENEGGPTDAG